MATTLMNSQQYLRHQLIYLRKNSNLDIVIPHKNHIKNYIHDWINQGLPFIYTRQPPNDECVHLGLTAFVDHQKHRISLRVKETMIEKNASLPLLETIFPFWQKNVDVQYQIHVYGSFLFQYLTNQPFVSTNSDLDILLVYKNYSLLEIKKLVETLNWTSTKSIDGEVRFGEKTETMDISVKELLTSSTSVLVKTVNNTYLLPRASLYATYPSLCA